MFNIGEFVVCNNGGVCQVEDIKTINMDGVSKERLYYVLSPLTHEKNRVFIPYDNPKAIIRKVMSKEDAANLIEKMPEIDELVVDNQKFSEKKYKEILRSSNGSELFGMIKMLSNQKKQRLHDKRSLVSVDEKYLKIAKERLCFELALALGISKEEVEKTVVSRFH
ncbi:MAG: CarD family transcriptional regulator [bacterium]|nr:CarD family transcriptional regulator [bacterium]